jgi:hypothetical protein
MQRLPAYLVFFPASLLIASCASGNVIVPDDKFFSDGYMPDKNSIQLVELSENSGLGEPAAERFGKNCSDAEIKARARFKTTQPLAKDEGRTLSRHLEKNAACRVRMVFKVN